MFSKACMYAIRALVLLASSRDPKERWTLPRIVEGTGAPQAFMGKILQQMVHAGLLVSVKGPGGGFQLPPGRGPKVALGEVVRAIDGDQLFSGCALGFDQCDARKPCPIHPQMTQVRERLTGILGSTSIQDLGEGIHSGRLFLRKKR